MPSYTSHTSLPLLISLLLGADAMADDDSLVQQRANAVVSLMTFTVVPDITASNLDIGSGTNQSAALNMTQIGVGATMSEAVPIYLEGAIGFSRYDPQFVVSNGTESRTLPTKWNSLTASGGIGWDIALHEDPRGGHWVLRPIANVSLGTMASDLRIGNWLLERRLQEVCTGVAMGLGATAHVRYERVYPATINTRDEARFAADVAQKLVGHEHVDRAMDPSMGAEDFSFMLQVKPGAYLRLGQGAENGIGSCFLHNSRYDFNDEVLPLGAALHASLIEQGLPLQLA